jgi:hypothetical protein
MLSDDSEQIKQRLTNETINESAEPFDASKPMSKEEWLKNQLKARATHYTDTRKMHVVIGSWNVNSKVPERGMDEWLRFDLNPDIIAIGLQEIDMTAKAMLQQETAASEEWLKAVERELQNAKSKYKRVSCTTTLMHNSSLACC